MALSLNRLTELYFINLERGEFISKRAIGRLKLHVRAGCLHKSGYRALHIDRKDYFEHNLIWFAAHGSWPPKGLEIDHINRNRADNRLVNLRLGTRSDNNGNMKIRKDNSTGHRGVFFSQEKRKYCVQVTRHGKTHCLGYFVSKEDAAKVASEARKKFFGEFASH